MAYLLKFLASGSIGKVFDHILGNSILIASASLWVEFPAEPDLVAGSADEEGGFLKKAVV